MRKRVFWFAVGVGITAFAVVKGREYYQRFTPKGVAEQIEKTSAGVGDWVADFWHTFTTAADEREGELREALGLVE